jgi:hypothetical protein
VKVTHGAECSRLDGRGFARPADIGATGE